MRKMFFYINSLENIDLSSFNTEKCNGYEWNVQLLFWNKKYKLFNFNTQNVTDMNSMFQQCNKLININLPSFKTQNTRENLGLISGKKNRI